MTESEWLLCADPDAMLEFIRTQRGDRDKWGRRKARLFACACISPILPLVGEECRTVVDCAIQYADGRIAYQAYRTTWKAALLRGGGSLVVSHACNPEVWAATLELTRWLTAERGYDMGQEVPAVRPRSQLVAMLREFFGNPFRPVTLSRSVLTPTVVSIARRVYDEQDFAAMPVLADALEEAGCTEVELLQHCRQPGEHHRGCWLLDLLLGKEQTRG